MKRTLALAGALALATAAGAQTTTTADDDPTTPDPVNRAHNVTEWDGPGPGAPGQPAPEPGSPGVMSQAAESFTPTPRQDYPTCSEEVRDNCVQRIDPGGSGA